MFLHSIGDVVFYVKANHLHSAPIIARQYTERTAAANVFKGAPGAMYETVHGVYEEAKLFTSREDVMENMWAGVVKAPLS